MTNARRQYGQVDQLALIAQVSSKCPICGKGLFYKKKGVSYKHYELAHIYPLNPSDLEAQSLVGEQVLGVDVNDVDNIIPLCISCHRKFDKPRTVEEYRTLVEKKLSFIRRQQQNEINGTYQLEGDIRGIVEKLYSAGEDFNSVGLEYDPKKVLEKLNETISLPTKQKIKHNVADYYAGIKALFLAIDCNDPGCSDLIYSQVRTYYLKQKSLNLPQQDVFLNVVLWINEKTSPQSIEAAEIVASFFIQNCEVFE